MVNLVRKLKHNIGLVLRQLILIRYKISGVSIGSDCFISLGAYIDERRGKIIIGDNCTITNGVKLLSHDATAAIIEPGKSGEYTTIIENNVFVGMDAIILPGRKIGTHSIVGAGSVVTKDIPPYCIVVGNPATIVKRFDHTEKLWRHTNCQ
jgi:acetyltransferase-like isoleucine patch superfamily enzyme